jgi:hypothetical protein
LQAAGYRIFGNDSGWMMVNAVGMPIQQRHVDRLREIMQSERNEELSNEEAWEMTRRLYNLFRLLLHGVIDGEDD